ncbi:MAG TPA: hypothetical protein VJK29_04275 [Terriglobales bacterium]|nr:hypothetical protein [Terriglobales bacterium]
MLFPQVPDWNLLPLAILDGDSEDSLRQENPFSVVAERTMAEVA